MSAFSPIAFTLGHEIRKAAFAMNNLVKSPAFLRDQSIPMPLLAKAVGLAVSVFWWCLKTYSYFRDVISFTLLPILSISRELSLVHNGG